MTNHWCMAMTLKPKPNHPNESVKSQDRKKHVKCEVFAHCFLRLQWRGALCSTVNKEYYLEVMRRLREVIRQKCTKLCKNQSWILHHDHAQDHASMLVREFLVQNLKHYVTLPALVGLNILPL